MAETTTTANADDEIARLPDPGRLPEVRLYGHSSLVYWWPVWLIGYAMALLIYLQGGVVRLDEARQGLYHMSSTPGLVFTMVLLLVILITNVRVRGIASLATILGIAFRDCAVRVARLVGQHPAGSAAARRPSQSRLLPRLFDRAACPLAARRFVFDRLVYWRVRPGQLTEERLIGGGEKSYDTHGMLFEQHGDDFFRHVILGLGAGDLKLMTTGAKKETIEIENVLFAQRKVARIQRLVAVSPDDAMALQENVTA